jgi:hypothetical protein
MAKSDDVPWLDADEQAAWFSLIGTLMRLHTGRRAGRPGADTEVGTFAVAGVDARFFVVTADVPSPT